MKGVLVAYLFKHMYIRKFNTDQDVLDKHVQNTLVNINIHSAYHMRFRGDMYEEEQGVHINLPEST